jgi:hypothetical protein
VIESGGNCLRGSLNSGISRLARKKNVADHNYSVLIGKLESYEKVSIGKKIRSWVHVLTAEEKHSTFPKDPVVRLARTPSV